MAQANHRKLSLGEAFARRGFTVSTGTDFPIIVLPKRRSDESKQDWLIRSAAEPVLKLTMQQIGRIEATAQSEDDLISLALRTADQKGEVPDPMQDRMAEMVHAAMKPVREAIQKQIDNLAQQIADLREAVQLLANGDGEQPAAEQTEPTTAGKGKKAKAASPEPPPAA